MAGGQGHPFRSSTGQAHRLAPTDAPTDHRRRGQLDVETQGCVSTGGSQTVQGRRGSEGQPPLRESHFQRIDFGRSGAAPPARARIELQTTPFDQQTDPTEPGARIEGQSKSGLASIPLWTQLLQLAGPQGPTIPFEGGAGATSFQFKKSGFSQDRRCQAVKHVAVRVQFCIEGQQLSHTQGIPGKLALGMRASLGQILLNVLLPRHPFLSFTPTLPGPAKLCYLIFEGAFICERFCGSSACSGCWE